MANNVTINLHIWSHLHLPLQRAKLAANQDRERAGLVWTADAVATFLSDAVEEMPPGHAIGELPVVDTAWLATVWNASNLPSEGEAGSYDDLPDAHKTVLGALADNPATVEELSKVIDMKPLSISSVLQKLHHKRMVERDEGGRNRFGNKCWLWSVA